MYNTISNATASLPKGKTGRRAIWFHIFPSIVTAPKAPWIELLDSPLSMSSDSD